MVELPSNIFLMIAEEEVLVVRVMKIGIKAYHPLVHADDKKLQSTSLG